jgi:hypothetical protein
MTHAAVAHRLPRSGNAALAAGALIQAAIGCEFLLAGLSKAANATYATQFKTFVASSPGSQHGLLSTLVQALIVPNSALVAQASKFTELVAGAILILAALDVARRRFDGALGAQHGYEPALALLARAAGLAVGSLSLGIYLIQGGMLHWVNPAAAFG